MTDSDADQRLAEAGRVLILAHRRLLAKAKMKVRNVEGVADDRRSTGGGSDAKPNDTP